MGILSPLELICPYICCPGPHHPTDHIQAPCSGPMGLWWTWGGARLLTLKGQCWQPEKPEDIPLHPSLAPSDTTGWGVSPRGAGYLFGSDVVAQFNAANDIDMICRAHQLVMEGYKWHFNETVLTVWSAPNYCYRCGNVAAILELDEHLQKDFIIFEAAPQETRGIPSKKPVADYFL